MADSTARKRDREKEQFDYHVVADDGGDARVMAEIVSKRVKLVKICWFQYCTYTPRPPLTF